MKWLRTNKSVNIFPSFLVSPTFSIASSISAGCFSGLLEEVKVRTDAEAKIGVANCCYILEDHDKAIKHFLELS